LKKNVGNLNQTVDFLEFLKFVELFVGEKCPSQIVGKHSKRFTVFLIDESACVT